MPSEKNSKTFAQRLDELWRSVYPAEQGRPYTYEEVARALAEAGTEVTGAHLHQLRTGIRANPRHTYVKALADFFGVPVDYFTSDAVAHKISQQIQELKEIRDVFTKAEASQAHAILLRAQGLSARSIEAIPRLMDQARELEGLPPVAEQRSGEPGDG